LRGQCRIEMPLPQQVSGVVVDRVTLFELPVTSDNGMNR
jgi:hypothetical protein